MKLVWSICIATVVLWFVLGGSTLITAKETTTLDEAVNRKHSDRNVSVFVDKSRGYVCYYRKTADGISCVPYPYR